MYTERYPKETSGNVANVGNFNAQNGLNVNDWNRDDRNDNLFVAPLIVSGKKIISGEYFAWWILSIRKAFSLFPEEMIVIPDTFFLLLIDYLYLVLVRFLINRALHLYV